MPRYFLEVSYKGTGYSGFQKQENANTIQSEVEKAFSILHQDKMVLTGSSRTDAGVHALQNFFHFDYDRPVHSQFVYKINALLPDDIVVVDIREVTDDAHCRFDAASRTYRYRVYQVKDAFVKDSAYYFPYKIDMEKLREAAGLILQYDDFTSFSKRNTQVKSFICNIEQSEWRQEENLLVYQVKANRFLRGMVRGLIGTMLKAGRDKISMEDLKQIIEGRDCSKADFAVPAKGLFLVKVEYPDTIFLKK